ncbi:MAG: helix-turn-helix domain-containing protein, partial [Azonexus sp.]|nr:helix-turn-helix domain-containing protein [Azonexus sp.]
MEISFLVIGCSLVRISLLCNTFVNYKLKTKGRSLLILTTPSFVAKVMCEFRREAMDRIDSEDEKERRGIQSIEVGGQILIALADHAAPMSLKQLAEAAQMSPAKAHPYLVSFSKLGLVHQDPVSGRYGLGPLALRMGLSSLRQLNPVRLGMAAAIELEQRVGHTVALSVWGNAGPTVIHLEESSHPIHMNLRAGTVMSLMTATGMVFAAYMPAKTVERFVEESMHPNAFPHIIGDRSDWKSLQPA